MHSLATPFGNHCCGPVCALVRASKGVELQSWCVQAATWLRSLPDLTLMLDWVGRRGQLHLKHYSCRGRCQRGRRHTRLISVWSGSNTADKI